MRTSALRTSLYPAVSMIPCLHAPGVACISSSFARPSPLSPLLRNPNASRSWSPKLRRPDWRLLAYYFGSHGFVLRAEKPLRGLLLYSRPTVHWFHHLWSTALGDVHDLALPFAVRLSRLPRQDICAGISACCCPQYIY